LKKKDKVLIIEDIISWDGTLISLIKAIKNKCKIIGVASVFKGGDERKKLKKKQGLK